MTFNAIVQKIRLDRGLSDCDVPGFDQSNGNEGAKYLFILEAPGPGARISKVISFDNNDPTARNFKEQLTRAEIERSDIALWNVVPWYLGDGNRIRQASANDLFESMPYLEAIINAMHNLCCIVLVGRAARNAHLFLSKTTDARILACHHPSNRVMNFNPDARDQNIKIFRFMKQTSN